MHMFKCVRVFVCVCVCPCVYVSCTCVHVRVSVGCICVCPCVFCVCASVCVCMCVLLIELRCCFDEVFLSAFACRIHVNGVEPCVLLTPETNCRVAAVQTS